MAIIPEKKDPIKCGDKTLGWIQRTGCDNYWTLASFEPGPDYAVFSELLEATMEEAEECVALEQVNDLKLTVGDTLSPVRDFQMSDLHSVEFKEGVWA